jgi:hypothetical protein
MSGAAAVTPSIGGPGKGGGWDFGDMTAVSRMDPYARAIKYSPMGEEYGRYLKDVAGGRDQFGTWTFASTPLDYATWAYLQEQNQGTTPTPPPVTPPGPSDQLQGLIAQASDPWSTYGQMGVANPYLNAINQRFGYNPQGLAFGYDIPATRTWYNPPYVYPNTVLPKISGGSGSADSGSSPWVKS